MVARLLYSVVGLGLVTLANVAVLPWSAAQASRSPDGVASAHRFRPVLAITRQAAPMSALSGRRSYRPAWVSWQPRRAPGVLADRKGRGPVSPSGRAGARKAVPVTRGQELGLRFRPDERESPYGQPSMPTSGTPTDPQSLELQSQFRPTEKRAKRTYEDLYGAEDASSAPSLPPPILPYPMMAPPPLPGYGRHWPEW